MVKCGVLFELRTEFLNATDDVNAVLHTHCRSEVFGLFQWGQGSIILTARLEGGGALTNPLRTNILVECNVTIADELANLNRNINIRN
jgi:hypothetical protein